MTRADCQKITSSLRDDGKRLVLGQPLITAGLEYEKLPNTVALGARSPGAISPTACGPQQILVELLMVAGMASSMLVLPSSPWPATA